MRPVLLALTVFSALSWGGSNPVPRVNHALAASFLPARFHVPNPALRTRLAELLQKQPQDSVTWAVWEGEELRISPDMAVRLGAFSDTAKRFHTRTRRVLERLAGSGIEELGAMSADAYYPNDPNFFSGQQWSLNNTGASLPTGSSQTLVAGKAGLDIGMTKVWDRFDGDDSLVIAVIDAGINFNHPDLKGRWFRNMREVNGTPGFDDDANGFMDDTSGWNFTVPGTDPARNSAQDYLGHGTECSGIIASTFDNGTGMAGMIPRVKILPIKVLDAAGSGVVTNVAQGVQYAVKMRVSAINFSLGGGTANAQLQAAFQAARDSGIPVIVAAGNEGVNLETNPSPPSSYRYNNIYTVAAHNHAGALSYFSNYGASTVAIAAPGENILSTGVPSPTGVGGLMQFQDTIDNGLTRWTLAAASNFVKSSSNPFTATGNPGNSSMQWQAGTNTWAATTNFIDLTGKAGSVLWFLLSYTPAGASDQLVIEGQIENSATWTTFANITSAVTPQWLSFDTHAMDGKRFKLRFRTLTTLPIVSSRVLILDEIREYYYDASPAAQATAYSTGGGTSFAAPYMAGYIGLLRIACKRANVAFTRARALAGVTAETGLAGKDSTGGRLDVPKGLAFYLNTLPGLRLTDSNKVAWIAGDTVRYTLSVPGAAASAYAFKSTTSLTGTALTTAGAFSWNSAGAKLGSDTVRFRAEGTPLVLRRMMVFALNPKSTGIPGISSNPSQPLLWVGDHRFILPANFFQKPRHAFVVERIDANGRSEVVFSGGLDTPSASNRVSHQLSGPEGPGWRVTLDGVRLQSQRTPAR